MFSTGLYTKDQQGVIMTEAFLKVSTTRLQDHEVYLFYRFKPMDLETGPDLSFQDLICGSEAEDITAKAVLPKDQYDVLKTRYAEQSVWQMTGSEGAQRPWSVSSDLITEIRDILGGRRPELATQWTLGVHAKRLLQKGDLANEGGAEKVRAKKLCLSHSKAAEKRLEASDITPTPLLVEVQDISVLAPVTGNAFCIVRIHFQRMDGQELSAIELTEAVAATGRVNNCYWMDEKKMEAIDGQKFSLGMLIRVLGEGCAVKGTKERRVETYTFVKTAEHIPTDQSEALGAFLARHYTSGYDLDMDKAEVAFIREFANMRHALAVEGVASILVPDKEGNIVSFLKDWKNNVFRSAYVPIILLGLHEHRYLTQSRKKALEAQTEDDSIQMYRAILDDALVFRLNLRFPEVSRISLHNHFNKRFRGILELEEKLTELEGDVKVVSERLISAERSREDAEENERHRRIYWVTSIGSASLAGLTAYTIAKETLKAFSEIEAHQISQCSVLFGIIIICVAWGTSLYKRPRKPARTHEGHIGKHVMYEHMIKRNLHQDH